MSLSEDPPSPATTQNIYDESQNLKPRAKPTEIIKHTNENIELYKKVIAITWSKKDKENPISNKTTENNIKNDSVTNNTVSKVPSKVKEQLISQQP